MRTHRLSWLALTETHMKQPDQFMINCYAAILSLTAPQRNTTAKQTFTRVSLITAPHLTPANRPHLHRRSASRRFTPHTTNSSSHAETGSGKPSQHRSLHTGSAHRCSSWGISMLWLWTRPLPYHTPSAHTSFQAKLPRTMSQTTPRREAPTNDNSTTSFPHRTTAFHRVGWRSHHGTDTCTKNPTT